MIKKIFDKIKKNKHISETHSSSLVEISWRDVVRECYDTGLNHVYAIIRVVYSDNKEQRAVILKRADGLFSVVYEDLYPYSDDELKYISAGLHGYWRPALHASKSIFDTEESAINAVYSEPSFKYNKSIVWNGRLFCIDTESLYWIKNDEVDDPNDLCLHGHVVAKIGEEFFEYDATVSATGMYLLRTLTENHIIHEDQAMLPCCGHFMIANEDCSSVDIAGCPNGVDWTVLHNVDQIKIITETGNETLVDANAYGDEVYAFTRKIVDFYHNSLPKNIPEQDAFSQKGYIAFWNEWHRRSIDYFHKGRTKEILKS